MPVTPAGEDTPGTKDEKRKLRSEGRARFKSELALYFPEYDVVMKNEEEEPSKYYHVFTLIGRLLKLW